MLTRKGRSNMKTRLLLSIGAMGLLLSGCLGTPPQHVCQWQMEKLQVIKGLEAPECAVVDPATGKIYASNMTLDPKAEGDAKFWGDDGTGSLSLLTDSKLEKLHWAKSNKTATMHSPKGLCIVGGQLWIADNHRQGEPARRFRYRYQAPAALRALLRG